MAASLERLILIDESKRDDIKLLISDNITKYDFMSKYRVTLETVNLYIRHYSYVVNR